MKNTMLPAALFRATTRIAWLGLLLAVTASVSAQNFIKNPDFEEPLGPDNWTFEYAPVFGGGVHQPTNCGPFDFMVAGPTTWAHKDLVPGTWDGEDGTGLNYWSKFGARIAPNHTWMMHGYFKQVVTNLTPRANYTISAWMAFFSRNGGYLDKCNIYLEVIGLNGSRTTPWPTANVTNINNYPQGWNRYSITTPAKTSGDLEVRLHFNKFGTTSTWEYRNFNAFYDHVSVVPTGQSEYLPSYKLISCVRSNMDIELSWQSVMNNSYRIQYTRDLTDPSSWNWLPWSRNMDTNIYAKSAVCTFKTNLACLFAADPTFSATNALFFRVYQRGFLP